MAGEAVYSIAYSGESDPGQQEIAPPFADALAQLDTNEDGRLPKDELVDLRAQARFYLAARPRPPSPPAAYI